MKNKKLAILLAVTSLSSNLSAKEYNSDVSNRVATKTQTYKQDEKILNNSKQEIAQSKNSNLAWKILRIGGKVLKWTFVGAGGVGFLRHVDNSYNSNAKQEILNLIDKYKTLSYNERLDGFIKVAEELIAKNEKAKAKRKKTIVKKKTLELKILCSIEHSMENLKMI